MEIPKTSSFNQMLKSYSNKVQESFQTTNKHLLYIQIHQERWELMFWEKRNRNRKDVICYININIMLKIVCVKFPDKPTVVCDNP